MWLRHDPGDRDVGSHDIDEHQREKNGERAAAPPHARLLGPLQAG
jgi:hypothetical protein